MHKLKIFLWNQKVGITSSNWKSQELFKLLIWNFKELSKSSKSEGGQWIKPSKNCTPWHGMTLINSLGKPKKGTLQRPDNKRNTLNLMLKI